MKRRYARVFNAASVSGGGDALSGSSILIGGGSFLTSLSVSCTSIFIFVSDEDRTFETGVVGESTCCGLLRPLMPFGLKCWSLLGLLRSASFIIRVTSDRCVTNVTLKREVQQASQGDLGENGAQSRHLSFYTHNHFLNGVSILKPSYLSLFLIPLLTQFPSLSFSIPILYSYTAIVQILFLLILFILHLLENRLGLVLSPGCVGKN